LAGRETVERYQEQNSTCLKTNTRNPMPRSRRRLATQRHRDESARMLFVSLRNT
jgi:hypothetical protein